MKDMIFTLRNDLKGKLNPFRYEHTISVSFICTALAMRYGCNLDKAELAGLLHDCAKPLRHYAEVALRIEPSIRGEGITFESQCHVGSI